MMSRNNEMHDESSDGSDGSFDPTELFNSIDKLGEEQGDGSNDASDSDDQPDVITKFYDFTTEQPLSSSKYTGMTVESDGLPFETLPNAKGSASKYTDYATVVGNDNGKKSVFRALGPILSETNDGQLESQFYVVTDKDKALALSKQLADKKHYLSRPKAEKIHRGEWPNKIDTLLIDSPTAEAILDNKPPPKRKRKEDDNAPAKEQPKKASSSPMKKLKKAAKAVDAVSKEHKRVAPGSPLRKKGKDPVAIVNSPKSAASVPPAPPLPLPSLNDKDDATVGSDTATFTLTVSTKCKSEIRRIMAALA